MGRHAMQCDAMVSINSIELRWIRGNWRCQLRQLIDGIRRFIVL